MNIRVEIGGIRIHPQVFIHFCEFLIKLIELKMGNILHSRPQYASEGQMETVSTTMKSLKEEEEEGEGEDQKEEEIEVN